MKTVYGPARHQGKSLAMGNLAELDEMLDRLYGALETIQNYPKLVSNSHQCWVDEFEQGVTAFIQRKNYEKCSDVVSSYNKTYEGQNYVITKNTNVVEETFLLGERNHDQPYGPRLRGK